MGTRRSNGTMPRCCLIILDKLAVVQLNQSYSILVPIVTSNFSVPANGTSTPVQVFAVGYIEVKLNTIQVNAKTIESNAFPTFKSEGDASFNNQFPYKEEIADIKQLHPNLQIASSVVFVNLRPAKEGYSLALGFYIVGWILFGILGFCLIIVPCIWMIYFCATATESSD